MAITYLLIPLIFRRQLVFKKLAQWQPYMFGIGVAGISLFMMGAGTLGVARRHWDITFTDAPLSVEVPGTAFLMMGLNGVFRYSRRDWRIVIYRHCRWFDFVRRAPR